MCWSVSLLTGWGQVSDDFNDGDDAGWTRMSPLAGIGGTSAYSFPGGNSYRIQVGASPNAAAVGQSRGGSLRADVNHSAFRVSVDVVAADASLEQDIGILARVTNPGLGTLNGYSATFDTDEGRVYLGRVDGEQPVVMDSVEVPLDAAKDYRIVFHGFGGQFLVEVFDVADLTTTIGTVVGFDDLYASGSTGLFGNAGLAEGTVDVTFDNFEAAENPDTDQDGMSDPVEVAVFGSLSQTGEGDFDGDGTSNADELNAGTDPTVAGSEFAIIDLLVEATVVKVAFFTVPGKIYRLEKSTDLKTWVVDEDAVFLDFDESLGGFESQRGGAAEYLRVTVGE